MRSRQIKHKQHLGFGQFESTGKLFIDIFEERIKRKSVQILQTLNDPCVETALMDENPLVF